MNARKITPQDPPQFPCWLWDEERNAWSRFHEQMWRDDPPTIERLLKVEITHWHPDHPTAPASPPDATAPSEPATAAAVDFHETYEQLAPSFGYETRADTKKFDPESKNGLVKLSHFKIALRQRQCAPSLQP